MKLVELKLLENDPQNRVTLLVSIDDKDYKKAIDIIKKANKAMPSPNTIQEEFWSKTHQMSDEIDYVLSLFDKAKIKYKVPEIYDQIKIEEGWLSKEELEAISSSKTR